MVSVKAFCAYLLYALSIAALFLYLLFPDDAVKAYMDSRLAAVDPSLTVMAETLRPSIPPGIKMIGVGLKRDGERLVRFEDARVSPLLGTLLGDKKQARFIAHLADGTINGRATMVGSGTPHGLQLEADLSQIRLDQVDALKANDHFSVFGVLKGHLTHSGGRAPQGTPVTSGLLAASGLRIAMKSDFFGISELIMEQADVEFSASGKNVRIKSLTFNGPMLEGKITGTIDLKRPFEQSRLNLNGNAKPQPELFARLQEANPQGIVNSRTLGTRGLNFRVRGTIDSPDFSMR